MRHPSRDQCEQDFVARNASRLNVGQCLQKLRSRKQRRKTAHPLGSNPVVLESRGRLAFGHGGDSSPSLTNQALEVPAPLATAHVGTAALGCPVERSSTLRQRNQRVQHVMQLIRIPHIRPSLFPHLRNRIRVQLAYFLQHRSRQHPPHLDRPRTPLLERRIVKVGIRIGIQNLVGKLRRHRRIHRQHTDLSGSHSAQQRLQSLKVHRLGENVLHDLIDERMVRNLNVTHDIFLASGSLGKN